MLTERGKFNANYFLNDKNHFYLTETGQLQSLTQASLRKNRQSNQKGYTSDTLLTSEIQAVNIQPLAIKISTNEASANRSNDKAY